jgi:2-polyprenyl-3-methyl-5-hydroxy-6-metoxy-1,4-benzoquinol methylase
MARWLRTLPFEPSTHGSQIWVYRGDDGLEEQYSVTVTLGKPIDILLLKVRVVEHFAEHLEQVSRSRTELFANPDNLERLESCPICLSTDTPEILRVYGAEYRQCRGCSHCFVGKRPTKEALEAFYSTDGTYQSVYADRRTTETRVQQVALPKAEWAVAMFEEVHKRRPRSILDVGAGSGHFVHACNELGIDADGVELSESGRRFARDTFGIRMLDVDFVEDASSLPAYDIITFWGVIEHVPHPLKMLQAASGMLAGRDGLVVAEVPRWNCFSTAVQSLFPESIVRHLDPLGHIHCFTDSSLASSFRGAGLAIVGAWYFGMDAYELVMQLAHRLADDKAAGELGRAIPALQRALDSGMLSDQVVFAGRPKSA